MNAWSQKELDVYEYWQLRNEADRYGLKDMYDKGKAEGKNKRSPGCLPGELLFTRLFGQAPR